MGWYGIFLVKKLKLAFIARDPNNSSLLFSSLEYVKNCLSQLILEHAQEQNITTDCSRL